MESTGVIVPIFTAYSAAQVNEVKEVIQAKSQYPSVPFLVAINPAGGPGGSKDSNFTTEVANMQAVGIVVLGYVPTTWGTRGISAVKADILDYHSWYHVNGIYLDQMPNWEYNSPNGTWYYSGPGGTYIPDYFANLTSYAKSLGMTKVFGNSGADVPENFVGTVDTMGIFENEYLPQLGGEYPALAGAGAWHVGYNKSNFAFFSYGISSIDPYYVAAASNYVSYLYITNMTGHQPYDALPPYFDQLVSILASMVPITVTSVIQGGNATASPGFNVTETQPDWWPTSAFTPYTFDAFSGSTIMVSAQETGSLVFEHWSDGSTDMTRALTPTQAMTLVAYYQG